MPEVVIIADDLTGANATSVLLSRTGYRAATFLKLEAYDEQLHGDFKIISISTDSRGVSKDIAYEQVSQVTEFFQDKNVKLFSKRIDSTLRGNVGSEIDAVLDHLDDDTIAIVVAAFPSSGRITIGGYLMVNSVPLENTDVAKDPKTPVYTSYVSKLIQEQSKYNVDYIPLSQILKDEDALQKNIIQSKEKGNKIIVMDATTNEDIEIIAQAVKSTGLKVIAVDPGPFTAALTKVFIDKPRIIPGQKVMLTVGSVSNLTRRQLEALKVKHDCLFERVNPKALIYDNTRENEISTIVENLINKMEDYNIIGVVTTTDETEVLDLHHIAKELDISEDDVSLRISSGLAQITRRLMEKTSGVIGGLFTSGGDVTVAVCKELQSAGIEVKDEVLPLAVYGRIIKGQYENMPIITKGGLIGEIHAITKCVDYLLTKVSTEYHKNTN
ncbi:four-carbon acid sugar kinase family protein [Vallitalea guaymasensis]|uniref:Four-carbon acid sugar kinase family protein n=1 Tax=Vallitalea guaymasensis TaxID=1185412 RepID=A0A8J8M888_9FIRM|nr:four-carbon acid sugar kinase family protein [Vallitalea guaymasensis]QUH28182.1 four-carbon acid sugar kinase family protein [Vallitalea guaymasensis]